MSSSAFAAVLVDNGSTLDIDSAAAPDSYAVKNNSTLNMTEATTRSIYVQTGSTLNISGATVTANPGQAGITINTSRATIDRAKVTSDTIALLVNRTAGGTSGSTVTAANSVFSGATAGAAVTGFGTLELINSEVTGTGAGSSGLIVAGGSARATGNTRISGDAAGVRFETNPPVGTASLVLDGSSVVGRNGPALEVDDGVNATIEVLNGSTLAGGNGNLLEVLGASTAAMRVAGSALQGNVQVTDNSTANLTFDQGRMTGDVVVENGSTANLTLQNGSQFTGRLDNVTGVTLSQSNWTMTGNDTVGSLTMDGGRVDFGDAAGAFRQLNIEALEGSGTFAMKGDFATGTADFLNVTGAANGQFGLEVAASGTDAVATQQLALVRTASGNAQFSLNGGRVDLGTWSYDLASATDGSGGTDWFLDPTTKTVSPGAQTALALFRTASTISYGELKSLENRMGDLQSDGKLHGVWVRPYGNKYNVAEGAGVAYQQRQQGVSLGADTRLGDGPWSIGVLAGYSQSDIDLKGGSSATVDSFYAGPYVGWQDPDNGYYVDGALKFNHFRNDSKVRLSDGTRAKGDYSNSAVSALVEVGRNIRLADDWRVKPSAQLSASVIEGASYDLDNGMDADGDRTRSLRAKLGVAAGRDFNMAGGTVVQPYGRVAMVHEFANNDNVHVNGNELNSDLSGSGFEVGGGVSVALASNVRVSTDLDYGKGENYEQPWSVTLGVSYGF
ncbi:autotransporter outer membrane beta-barrel domain-containing protein [Pseudomonas sp. BF-R-19]|uniref:autotransporter outer membrane beta-barrel domain-containing protein n=1 Tax=Pseudomonas sp. BF-R-19 TaxID=2832397 RepID=UPI001CBB5FC1|nr:autotransporter outer membrane beta-barrel domain-containing protein [Pseudomonas sp. BF-R-19]